MKERSPIGYRKFIYKDKTMRTVDRLYPKELLDMYKVNIHGTIMSGEAFYNLVDERYIIDSDGSLGKVFIDGFLSNLGLYHEGFTQGHFAVDGSTWQELCKKYAIEVEWCNK